jgi:hypothetical protein
MGQLRDQAIARIAGTGPGCWVFFLTAAERRRGDEWWMEWTISRIFGSGVGSLM